MIVYDFEVFKHDWMLVWLDLDTQKFHYIINDKTQLEQFYEKYKHTVWIGYNSRGYDQWIAKAILCDINPYKLSDWIINKERKGWEYSNLFRQFPIINYDCSVGFRSLKELEGFMGHDIRETSVPFDIDRKLTDEELQSILKYCKHDVWETFHVFVETKTEWESQLGLVQEFKLPFSYLSKTKAQLSAEILECSPQRYDDEFEISFPDTLVLGQYEYLKYEYNNWAKNKRDYEQMKFDKIINGVPHTFGIGGLHGAISNYVGEGTYIMADVGLTQWLN